MISPFSFPLIKSSIGISFGILASFSFPEIPFVPLLPVFVLVLFIGSMSIRKFNLGTFWFESILVWMFLVSLGGTLFRLENTATSAPAEGTIQGQLLVESIRFRSNLISLTGFISTSHQIFKVQALYFTQEPDTLEMSSGQTLSFKGHLTSINGPINPYEFDFKEYANQQGIQSQLIIEQLTPLEYHETTKLKVSSKEWLNAQLKLIPHEGVRSLLWAFTTGDKSKLNKQIKVSFGLAGVMHLLAVSGLHVSLIAGLPLFFLKRSRKKWKQYLFYALTLTICWSYAWLTGFQPSVIRASLMCSLVGLSFCLRVSTNSINQLGAAATMMLIVQPSLLFSVGFQLSFAAVAGILIWAPILIATFNSRNKVVAKILNGLSVSFAAQAGSAPLSVYYFHQFPLLFLLANFIAIPLATLFLYTSLLFLFTQSAGSTPDWLVRLVILEGELLLNWAKWLSEISWGSVEGLWLTIPETVGTFVVLHFFFIQLAKKRIERNFRPLLIAVGLCMVLFLVRPIPTYEITFFGGSKNPHVGVRMKNEAFIYYTSDQKRYLTKGWVTRFGATAIEFKRDTIISENICSWKKGAHFGLGPFRFTPKNEHKKTAQLDGINILYEQQANACSFYIPMAGNLTDTLHCLTKSGVYDFNSAGDLVSKRDLHNLPKRGSHSRAK